MYQKLFQDFESVSSKQWKQQIQFELKGADYNDVVWETPENLKIKPFYHFDETVKNSISNPKNAFQIIQPIFVFDLQKSIKKTNNALVRGAESIHFTIDNDTISIEKLLNGITEKYIEIFVSISFFSDKIMTEINEFATKTNQKITVLIDPIHYLTTQGNWIENELKNNFEVLNSYNNTYKNINCISVNATTYQNAGANFIQQIAYTIAHITEYFNHVNSISNTITIQVSVGTNYFFEIAKLKVIRQLFTIVATEFNSKASLYILATPTKRNKTIYDYNTNMLRTTTECMSAILGSANGICNYPYDEIYHKTNEFSDRIARNQLLILKHESYFDKVLNPTDGSYYIENLTNQLADNALKLYKEIELKGGFVKLLSEGVVQNKIKESATIEQEAFNIGKEILLGTNKYPNNNDKMKMNLELFPFVKIKPRKTLIIPIIEKRLAEKIEQERLNNE